MWRDGKAREVGEEKLGETPAEKVAEVTPAAGKPSQLGLVVRPLTQQEMAKLNTPHGVVVERRRVRLRRRASVRAT